MIHHDLKPGNILYFAEGNIKITDFGCSKILPPSEKKQDKNFGGTEDYMAPEVL